MEKRGFYRETEDHYTNILYEYILSESVFATNDGVLREKQVRSPQKKGGPVVDLLTKLGETYIGIEVKVWPHTFEECFEKTSHFFGKIDCAFVAIPVEYVSIAKDIADKRSFPSGILPISLITKPVPVKKSQKMGSDPEVKKALESQFTCPYYGYPWGEIGSKEVEYYEKVWHSIADLYRPTKKKIAGNVLALLVFYAMGKIYSFVKYLLDIDIRDLTRELAKDARVSIAKYGVPWGLYELGLTETHQMGRAKVYHRLNPRFMMYLNNQGKNRLNKFLTNNRLKDALNHLIQKKKEDLYRKRVDEVINYIERR